VLLLFHQCVSGVAKIRVLRISLFAEKRNAYLISRPTIVILEKYPILLNIIYYMHTVLVIMDVSYGRYQRATLTSFVLLGGRA